MRQYGQEDGREYSAIEKRLASILFECLKEVDDCYLAPEIPTHLLEEFADKFEEVEGELILGVYEDVIITNAGLCFLDLNSPESFVGYKVFQHHVNTSEIHPAWDNFFKQAGFISYLFECSRGAIEKIKYEFPLDKSLFFGRIRYICKQFSKGSFYLADSVHEDYLDTIQQFYNVPQTTPIIALFDEVKFADHRILVCGDGLRWSAGGLKGFYPWLTLRVCAQREQWSKLGF